MESDLGGPQYRLQELTDRRESLRARLTLPWWWFATWSVAVVVPGLMLGVPEDLRLPGYAAGLMVMLALVWFARRGRGVRFVQPRERISAWRAVAGALGGVAVSAAMIGIAWGSGRPWLMIPMSLGLAAALALAEFRHQKVRLRDEDV